MSTGTITPGESFAQSKELRTPKTPTGSQEPNPLQDPPSPSPSNEDLEADPPTRIKWRVKGPLYEGPVQSGPKTLFGPQSFISARRRKLVRQYLLWKERRDLFLSLAEMFFNRSTNARPKMLSREAEGYYQSILTQLDSVLTLVRGRPFNSSLDTPLGYHIDEHEYHILLTMLEGAYKDHLHTIRELNLSTPSLPVWIGDEQPQSIWEEHEAELFSVCFREDVENYLAFLWDIPSIYEGTYSSGIQTFISPDMVHSKDVVQREALYSQHSQAVLMVMERRNQTEEVLSSISRKQSQKKGKVKQVSQVPHREEAWLQGEDDMSEIRKGQVSTVSHKSRPSVTFTSPYGNIPSRISDSDVLKEMFEDDQPPRKRRETIFHHLPETPLKYPTETSYSSQVPIETSKGDENLFTELPSSFGKIPQPSRKSFGTPSRPPGPPGGDPGDGSDGEGPGGPKRNPFPRKPYVSNSKPMQETTKDSKLEAYFDNKLRPDIVPEWDGDSDTLASWILKVNHLARRSDTIFKQLGEIVPLRMRASAEKWFFSLPLSYRQEISTDWKTLKNAIGSFYMNRAWLDKQKARASNASFRESGYNSESPSEYYIRKSELLRLVNKLTDSELILEVMAGAPEYWSAILDIQRYETAVDFQTAIKYHESALAHPPFSVQTSGLERRIRALEIGQQKPSTGGGKGNYFKKPAIRTYLIGTSPNTSKPPFPKDDSNVSKKATPESRGARPCRHCGSGKHWDYECKHATKGMKIARTRIATSTSDDTDAQEEYDDLYYNLESDTEDEEDVTCNSVQASGTPSEEPDEESEATVNCTKVQALSLGIKSSNTKKVIMESSRSQDISKKKDLNHATDSEDENNENCKKRKKNLPLDSSMFRRKKKKEANKSEDESGQLPEIYEPPGEILQLTRTMARPPGCSFLGAKATTTDVWLGEYGKNPQSLIADSGSDISLISQDAL